MPSTKGGQLVRAAVNLMLFVGVVTFCGMVGWLLGSAIVEVGRQ